MCVPGDVTVVLEMRKYILIKCHGDRTMTLKETNKQIYLESNLVTI